MQLNLKLWIWGNKPGMVSAAAGAPRLVSADANFRGSYRKTLRVQEKQSTFQAANRGHEAVHLKEIGALRSSGALLTLVRHASGGLEVQNAIHGVPGC